MDQFKSVYTARRRARSRDAFYVIEETPAYSRFGVQGHGIRRKNLGMRPRKISLSDYDFTRYDIDGKSESTPKPLELIASTSTDRLVGDRAETSKTENDVNVKYLENSRKQYQFENDRSSGTDIFHKPETEQQLTSGVHCSPNCTQLSTSSNSESSLSKTEAEGFGPHIIYRESQIHQDDINPSNNKNDIIKESIGGSHALNFGIEKPLVNNSSFAPKALSNLHRLSVLKNLKLRTPAHNPVIEHLPQAGSNVRTSQNGLVLRHQYKIVTPVLDLQHPTRILLPNYTRLKTPSNQGTQLLSSTHTSYPSPNAFHFSSKNILSMSESNINSTGQSCDKKSETIPSSRTNPYGTTEFLSRERERQTSLHFHVAPSQNGLLQNQRDLKPLNRVTDHSMKMSVEKVAVLRKTEDGPEFQNPAEVIVQNILNQTWVREQNTQVKRQFEQSGSGQGSLVRAHIGNGDFAKRDHLLNKLGTPQIEETEISNGSKTEANTNLSEQLSGTQREVNQYRQREDGSNHGTSNVKATEENCNLDRHTVCFNSQACDVKIATDNSNNGSATVPDKTMGNIKSESSTNNEMTSTNLQMNSKESDKSGLDMFNAISTTGKETQTPSRFYDVGERSEKDDETCKQNKLENSLDHNKGEQLPVKLEPRSLEGNRPKSDDNNSKACSKDSNEFRQKCNADGGAKSLEISENDSHKAKFEYLVQHVRNGQESAPTSLDEMKPPIPNAESITSTRCASIGSKNSIYSSVSTTSERNCSPSGDLHPSVTSRKGSHDSLKIKEDNSVYFKDDNCIISKDDNSSKSINDNASRISVPGIDPLPGSRVRGEWIVCRDYSKASKNSTEYGGKHNVWTTKEKTYNSDKTDNNGDHAVSDPNLLCNNGSQDDLENTEYFSDRKHHLRLRYSEKDQIFTAESESYSRETSLSDKTGINPQDNIDEFAERKSRLHRMGQSETNLSKAMSKSSESVLASKLSFRFSEMAKNRNKEYRSFNRFLGNRLITKEIHLNRPISRELMFKNRPISKEMKTRNRPMSRESVTDRLSRQGSFTDRPMSVGLFGKKTRMENIHKVCQPIAREILTSRAFGKEQIGQRQEIQDDLKPTLSKTETAKFIHDVDTLQSFQTRDLNPVPFVNDSAQEMLDYFWSYQGMGRQILGVKSREGIQGKGTESSDISLFEKFDKLPPIDRMTSQNVDGSGSAQIVRNSVSDMQNFDSGAAPRNRVQLVIKLPQPNREEE